MAKYIVGITGASGSIYGIRMVEELVKKDHEVYLVITNNGKKVLSYELERDFDEWIRNIPKSLGKLHLCPLEDMFSKIASGSFYIDGMVIAPCSMGTLAKIASGITDNLLIRAADVMIKEKRKLIIVPRETPLNRIHLKNMLFLSEMDVIILPPMPAFYQRPKTLEELVDITVGRIMTSLDIESELHHPWHGNQW